MTQVLEFLMPRKVQRLRSWTQEKWIMGKESLPMKLGL